MKILRSLSVVLAFAVPVMSFAAEPSAAAAPAAPAEKSQADLDYEAMMSAYRAPLPAGLDRKEHTYWELMDQKMLKLMQDARAFAAKHPADPRRYEGLIQSSYTRPYFIRGFKPEFDDKPGEANLVVDQEALNAFRAAQIEYLSDIVAQPDATPRHRGGGFYALLIDARADARARGQAFDVTAFAPVVERVLAVVPDERALPVVEQYLGALKQDAPEKAAAFDARVRAMPALAAAIAEANAKREAAAAEKRKKLADVGAIKFTAADGREVDVAKLKGKVVLIDFWATWCGPCVAEIPNVVANYNKYHDRGFEVIGVTLEASGVTEKDDAAARERKLGAAKRKMVAFTEKNRMPWPQYFDGLHWQNEISTRFNIDAIPAMFLLDKEGNLVSTTARGERLEPELKKLLGLN